MFCKINEKNSRENKNQKNVSQKSNFFGQMFNNCYICSQ